MGVFDPGGAEGRDGSLPDETARRPLCPEAPEPRRDERRLAKLPPSAASITRVKADALHIQ